MSNLKVGMEFTASDGRRGVITSIRYNTVPSPDGIGWVDGNKIECVFVRPADRKAVEAIEITGDTTVRGSVIMSTAWYVRGDKLAGIWADSKIGAADVFVNISDSDDLEASRHA